jgi:hypothetical protein
MVNDWLKSQTSPKGGCHCAPEDAKQRTFATKPALTSPRQRRPGRSEVVLEETILGLLINGPAAIAAGN